MALPPLGRREPALGPAVARVEHPVGVPVGPDDPDPHLVADRVAEQPPGGRRPRPVAALVLERDPDLDAVVRLDRQPEPPLGHDGPGEERLLRRGPSRLARLLSPAGEVRPGGLVVDDRNGGRPLLDLLPRRPRIPGIDPAARPALLDLLLVVVVREGDLLRRHELVQGVGGHDAVVVVVTEALVIAEVRIPEGGRGPMVAPQGLRDVVDRTLVPRCRDQGLLRHRTTEHGTHPENTPVVEHSPSLSSRSVGSGLYRTFAPRKGHPGLIHRANLKL